MNAFRYASRLEVQMLNLKDKRVMVRMKQGLPGLWVDSLKEAHLENDGGFPMTSEGIRTLKMAFILRKQLH